MYATKLRIDPSLASRAPPAAEHEASAPSSQRRRRGTTNGVEPRADLIHAYLPLVRRVVAQLARRLPSNVARGDLLAAGVFGLVDSLRRNTGERGAAFEGYARTRIRGAVFDELRAQDWLSRRARAGIERADGSAVASFVSIEDVSADDGAKLRDDIDPAAIAEMRCDRRLLAGAIAELPERERRVVAMHYFEGLKMKDISVALGVSEPRVSQLHARALDLLRSALERAA